jgi:hypothetical protein
VTGISRVTIWRRVMPTGVSGRFSITSAGAPGLAALRTGATFRGPDRIRARRGRLNVKPSPKSRALDRAFALHVGMVSNCNVRAGTTVQDTVVVNDSGARPVVVVQGDALNRSRLATVVCVT